MIFLLFKYLKVKRLKIGKIEINNEMGNTTIYWNLEALYQDILTQATKGWNWRNSIS